MAFSALRIQLKLCFNFEFHYSSSLTRQGRPGGIIVVPSNFIDYCHLCGIVYTRYLDSVLHFSPVGQHSFRAENDAYGVLSARTFAGHFVFLRQDKLLIIT